MKYSIIRGGGEVNMGGGIVSSHLPDCDVDNFGGKFIVSWVQNVSAILRTRPISINQFQFISSWLFVSGILCPALIYGA